MNDTICTLLNQSENLAGTTAGFEALIRAVRFISGYVEHHLDATEARLHKLELGANIIPENLNGRIVALEKHAQVPEDISGRFICLEERLDRFELALAEAGRNGNEDVKRLDAKIDGTKAIIADLAKRVPEPKPDPVRTAFESHMAQRLANGAKRFVLNPKPPLEAGEFQMLVCASCHEVIGYNTTPTTPSSIVACPRCHRHLTSLLAARKNG